MRCAVICVALVMVLSPTGAMSSEAKSPAIKSVVTMLENLVTTIDEEAAKDEETFTHFSNWCTEQISLSETSIERLQGEIEEVTATLGHLRSKKMELDTHVAALKASIHTETTQLNAAREKRAEENAYFVSEQQQFDGAISACNRAVEILAAHYGSGEQAPLEKPGFMSLVSEQVELVRRAATPLKKHLKGPLFVGLLQTQHRAAAVEKHRGSLRQPTTINNNRYQDSSGEASGIVDQVNEIGATFSEDKQSAINDENKLQELFDTLAAEKTALLNELTAELNTQSAILTKTNEEIALKEGQLARAERELTDTQAYLSRTKQNKADATDAYNMRQADRAGEKEAVQQAMGVLQSFLEPSLVQRTSVLRRMKGGLAKLGWDGLAPSSAMLSVLSMKIEGSSSVPCAQCKAAADLLRDRAERSHSELLQAAASATLGAGNEAITEIIASLNEMIHQIHEQQKSETEHKDWCEEELGLTNQKVTDHSSVIDHLTGVLANLKEILVEDKQELAETKEDIVEETHNFEELTHLREEGKEEYEHAHEETSEAIAALNEAIAILAKFYAERKERNGGAALLIQTRGGQPTPSKNDGSGVVNMISHTRGEFEVAKTNLEKEEHQAEEDYEDARVKHIEVDTNLNNDKNMETTDVQTDDQTIDQTDQDLTQEKEDKASAKAYLDQLGRSCYMLLNNYEDRKKRRSEEETAIKDAIEVLKDHA